MLKPALNVGHLKHQANWAATFSHLVWDQHKWMRSVQNCLK